MGEQTRKMSNPQRAGIFMLNESVSSNGQPICTVTRNLNGISAVVRTHNNTGCALVAESILSDGFVCAPSSNANELECQSIV